MILSGAAYAVCKQAGLFCGCLMELLLVRHNSGVDSTTGVLNNLDTGLFYGYTCEDEFRTHKVMGETRIPAGRYEVKLRREGGMLKRYRERYGNWHVGMLHLQDVPGFKWVYIHVGNDDADTAGCILLGYGANTIRTRSGIADGGTVSNSTGCYKDFYKQVIAAMERGEAVFIRIVDSVTELDL